MATYVVTEANWNDPAFWASISETGAGHTLDFSALPSNYSVSWDPTTNRLTISDGTTSFVIRDDGATGRPDDASLGGTTLFDFFTNVIGTDGADYIWGGSANETLNGGAGDDTVMGWTGDDSLLGGDGNDLLQGQQGSDTVDGGAGSDTVDVADAAGTEVLRGGESTGDRDVFHLTGSTGASVTFTGDEAGTYTFGPNTGTFSEFEEIHGSTGADTINASATTSGIILTGDAGNDSLIGGSGADTLQGNAGLDTIRSGDGAASINGGAGDDVIFGGGGDDTIRQEDTNNDTVYGGAGTDVLDLSGVTISGVNVTFSDIEVIYGSDEATGDIWSWDFEDVTFFGGLANDTITGGAGSDTLSGGSGADSLTGGLGADSLTGGQGNDTLIGDGTALSTTSVLSGQAETGTNGVNIYEWSGGTGDSSSIRLDDGTGDIYSADDVGDAVYVVNTGNGATLTLEAYDYFLDEIFVAEAWTGSSVTEIVPGHHQITLTYASGNTQTFEIYHDNGSDFMLEEVFQVGLAPSLQTASDTISGGDGNDSIIGGNGYNIIQGDAGNDTLIGGAEFDDIYGGTGDDSIDGGADADSLVGDAGYDSILGGDGSDTLTGGAGADSLTGGADADRFLATDSFGNDTITGGETTTTGTDFDVLDFTALTTGITVDWTASESGTAISGADTITWSEIEQIVLTNQADSLDASAETVNINVDGAGGNDTLTGGTGNDNLFGDTGNDTLYTESGLSTLDGGAGNDRLEVKAGNTTVSGGAGDDFLTVSDAFNTGTHLWDGSDGSDTINIIDHTATFTLTGGEGGTDLDVLDLNTAAALGRINVVWTGAEAGNFSYDSGFAVGTFSQIEVVRGDWENDSFDARTLSDGVTAFGEGGNDNFYGGSGADYFEGGTGADTLRLYDGFGADTLIGGEGGTDDDWVMMFTLTTGVSLTTSGTGAGTFSAGGSTATFSEIERFTLTDSADAVDLTNDLSGMYVDSQDGDDAILGGAGNDTLLTYQGNDWVDGGAGDDSIRDFSSSNNTIFGGDGNDTIDSGAWVDTLDGGAGNDSIISSGGDNFITGGDGADTILGGWNDDIFGGNGDDYIDGRSAWDLIEGDAGNDTLYGGGGNDSMSAGDGDDSLLGGDGDDTLHGGDGNDLMYGINGNDTLEGGDGLDTLWGGSGITTLDGGGGNDQIFASTLGSTIDAGDGADTVTGSVSADSIDGGLGNDSILGNAGNDTIAGEDGDDFIDGGDGDDLLTTGEGNDTLEGGAGNDTLDGGADNDSLVGGTGNDSLTGGDGDDIFVYTAGDGADTITDFNFGNTGSITDGLQNNNDFIDLSAFYSNQSELRDDFADDGILNQSNDGVNGADYSDNTAMAPGDSLQFDGATRSSFTADNTNVVCFSAGTRIMTPRGEVPVELLRPGDKVMTRDNGLKPILWIAARRLTAADLARWPRLRPIHIAPGLVGADAPLIVSPQHGMLLRLQPGEEHLVRAVHLARLPGGQAHWMHGCKSVTYIHLMFEAHQIIYANGAPSESFYPGPQAISALDQAARAEMTALFPDLTPKNAPETYGRYARPFTPFKALPDHLKHLISAK